MLLLNTSFIPPDHRLTVHPPLSTKDARTRCTALGRRINVGLTCTGCIGEVSAAALTDVPTTLVFRGRGVARASLTKFYRSVYSHWGLSLSSAYSLLSLSLLSASSAVDSGALSFLEEVLALYSWRYADLSVTVLVDFWSPNWLTVFVACPKLLMREFDSIELISLLVFRDIGVRSIGRL